MKKLTLLTAVALSLLFVMPSMAQIKFGVKAGVNVSQLSYTSLKSDLGSLDLESLKGYSEDVTGFTGGLMTEIAIPYFGLGVDASVMYSRKGGTVPSFDDVVGSLVNLSKPTIERVQTDYIDIPLNLKWKVGLPFAKVFLAAGPSFQFLVNDNLEENIMKQQNFNVAINLGGGIELFEHLQVAAQYGIGLNSASVDLMPSLSGSALDLSPSIEAKDRYWTLTAAYLF